MTYFELLSKANRLLDKGEITVGQHDEMVKPLWDEIRPKGKWSDDEHGYFQVYCSVCKETNRYTTNFCPNCGADMRGGAE